MKNAKDTKALREAPVYLSERCIRMCSANDRFNDWLHTVYGEFTAGDWGDIDDMSRETNDYYLTRKGWLQGSYLFDHNDEAFTVWIMSNPEHSENYILLPCEYDRELSACLPQKRRIFSNRHASARIVTKDTENIH